MRHRRGPGWGSTLAVACLASLPSMNAWCADAERSSFGKLPDGSPVEAVTLTSPSGVRARVMTYGATLQSLEVPDRTGGRADIVLGYDTAADYAEHPNYFGATIGRFANRIGGGAFVLDGRRHALSVNDQRNSLHGGAEGFDKRLWRIVAVESGRVASVRLGLRSVDGDQGYPGNLDVEVSYTLDDAGSLAITHRARTDAPTVVNLTNHSLFNLAGEGGSTDVLAGTLTIPAARFTPVNPALIPTGELKAVAGTPFDFRSPRRIGEGIRDGRDPQIVAGRGIDHNYALDAGPTREPKLAARLADASSGRVMEVWSTEPGLQVYTGNFLAGTVIGKRGHVYRMGDGIALEPQRFPDMPNQPAFGSARLDPGQSYEHRMVLRFPTAR